MMTIINPWEIKRRSEAGIALVVVLGLLALMTLVATAFVYFMRTENTAAHYYRLDVSSKHVLNVALSRALMDLNYDLRTDVYPRWSGQYNVLMSARDTNDPPLGSSEREFAAAMSSAISNMPGGVFQCLGVARQSDDQRLLTSSTDYQGQRNVLVVNLSAATVGWIWGTPQGAIGNWSITVTNQSGFVRWTQNDRFAIIPLPEWDLVDVDQMTARGFNSDKQVKYAYAIFNASGLLDANYVGGDRRQMGQSSREIQLNALVAPTREFIDQSALDDFYLQRTNFSRNYESVRELYAMNEGFAGWPDNFIPYSRFPQGGFSPANPLVLTGEVSHLATMESSFKNSLMACSPRYNNNNSKWVFDSLMDYLDRDSIPTNLAGPSMERCPMINEIGITNYLTVRPDGTATHMMVPIVEVCYPFLLPPTVNNYRLEIDLLFAVGSGLTDSRFVPSPNFRTVVRVLPPMAVGNKYRSIALPAIQTTAIYTNLAAINKPNLRLLLQIRRAQIYDAGNNLVDAIPYPTNYSAGQLFFFVPFQEPAGYVLPTNAVATTNQINLGWAGMECVDPRFNWRRVSATNTADYYWKTYRPTNSVQADRTSPSLGYINHSATNHWKTSNCADFFDDMHVPVSMLDRTLQNLCELGYLPVEKWDTVRLVGGRQLDGSREFQPDPILNVFSLAASAVSRGKVNPNTRDEDVLAAVLCNMPMDQYPNQPNVLRFMTTNEAYQLAGDWVDNLPPVPIASYNDLMTQYTNLMDNPSGSLFSLFSSTNHSVPFRNESLVRNTFGLFDARQNYFYVVLCASEITRGFLRPTGAGYQQPVFTFNNRAGLVELWRDPYRYPDTNSNALIMRNYRRLDD